MYYHRHRRWYECYLNTFWKSTSDTPMYQPRYGSPKIVASEIIIIMQRIPWQDQEAKRFTLNWRVYFHHWSLPLWALMSPQLDKATVLKNDYANCEQQFCYFCTFLLVSSDLYQFTEFYRGYSFVCYPRQVLLSQLILVSLMTLAFGKRHAFIV